ncbi:MAG: hypothetical protein WBE92_17080 [Steroidobacteraceae bacterium]
MSSNFLKRVLHQLRAESAASAEGGPFLRLMFAVAAIFFVGSLLAIGRIAWALDHGVAWVNYRGSPLSRGEMYTALALSTLVALCSVGVVASLRRALRWSR